MKNKKYRHVLVAASMSLSLATLGFSPESSFAGDLSEWQKGVIEGAFMFNPHLRSRNVQVEIQNNRAILRGYVDSELGRALAEQFALSVKGIDEVMNRLLVTPDFQLKESQQTQQATEDQNRLANVTITNKVLSQLLANRVTSGMEIDVETRDRTVTLSGEVGSDGEKILTYWIVKNTQGVKTVVNQLDVVSESTQQVVVQLAD
jgi:hyperosmotically inducible periplasmic protein